MYVDGFSNNFNRGPAIYFRPLDARFGWTSNSAKIYVYSNSTDTDDPDNNQIYFLGGGKTNSTRKVRLLDILSTPTIESTTILNSGNIDITGTDRLRFNTLGTKGGVNDATILYVISSNSLDIIGGKASGSANADRRTRIWGELRVDENLNVDKIMTALTTNTTNLTSTNMPTFRRFSVRISYASTSCTNNNPTNHAANGTNEAQNSDITVSGGVVVINSKGVYNIMYNNSWTSNTTGTRTLSLSVSGNGTNSYTTSRLADDVISETMMNFTVDVVSVPCNFTATCTQSSGGSLTVDGIAKIIKMYSLP
jgi:hypothetical protein